jgi:hypothetical protein
MEGYVMTDSNITPVRQLDTGLSQSFYDVINDPSRLRYLEYSDLLLLLNYANNEMTEIEKYLLESQKVMVSANDNLDTANQYSKNKYILGGALVFLSFPLIGTLFHVLTAPGLEGTVGITFALITLCLTVAIIGGFLWLIKYSKKQKEKLIITATEKQTKANNIINHTQQLINNSRAIYAIPSDYRYTFALSSMISILNRQLADDWKSVAYLFEKQVRENEKISVLKESLEYQKITALATSISAIIDITRLF